MERDREKKTIRQHFLDWWLPVVALILVVGAGRSFVLWQDRNYGQLTTSLITVLGVVVTLWMTQVRAIEQQEREDKRHHARLEAEAEMQDQRLKAESKREHERLTVEAQKDRVQRSITQRIDLSEKLASAVDHLSSSNELQQAAGVQEILFQIDDWHALIESEIAAIKGEDEEVDANKAKLQQESLRRRQELFDIAYKFSTKNVELLKSRARGLKQRLTAGDRNSLVELDFSGMVVGRSASVEKIDFQIDLKDVDARGFRMANSEMCYVDLRFANFEEAKLGRARLKGAILHKVNLKNANLSDAYLEEAVLTCACLEGAQLSNVNLKRATLSNANLKKIKPSDGLTCANFEEANLIKANLEEARMPNVRLQRANLSIARIEKADLSGGHLEGANLSNAHLEGANLSGAHLEGANLSGACLEKTLLPYAYLQGADLRDVNFDQIALRDKKLLYRAEYNNETKFPDWLDPDEHGMRLVDETEDE